MLETRGVAKLRAALDKLHQRLGPKIAPEPATAPETAPAAPPLPAADLEAREAAARARLVQRGNLPPKEVPQVVTPERSSSRGTPGQTGKNLLTPDEHAAIMARAEAEGHTPLEKFGRNVDTGEAPRAQGREWPEPKGNENPLVGLRVLDPATGRIGTIVGESKTRPRDDAGPAEWVHFDGEKRVENVGWHNLVVPKEAGTITVTPERELDDN